MKYIILTLFPFLFTMVVNAQDFYVGTYTKTTSEGIYHLNLDAKKGTVSLINLAAKSVEPSYVAFSKDHKYVVAVNEISDSKAKNKDGEVSLFTVDKSTGNLTFINKVPSGGAHPCYVSLDENNTVFVANYSGGNVGVFQIKDGLLAPHHQVIQYEGKGPNKQRQEAAHAHFAHFDPKQKEVFTVDLGNDIVHVYGVEEGRLTEKTTVEVAKGSGPRHVNFSSDRKVMYVLNELTCTISIFNQVTEDAYAMAGEITTLPKSFDGKNTCAAIKVSKDGKYLYASNRGHNSIAMYKIDKGTGLLTNIGYAKVHGDSPRDFSFSPKEDYVVVANQVSNNVVVLKRDKKTGILTYSSELEVPQPVNIIFF
ncbi:lactonase family protein [Flammeovirga pectinis]|uniref:Lactonase family protein n=1 Tax=Flammeovirga pectinis TaxID=2494373 RepID=A0A3S9NZF3_9BACT|nr:lactonase family protein [Flammeovirga pectinis]AZQ61315.1 lactonase family protein [Flammeovirga pectinis]